jgi:hypothetical protein
VSETDELEVTVAEEPVAPAPRSRKPVVLGLGAGALLALVLVGFLLAVGRATAPVPVPPDDAAPASEPALPEPAPADPPAAPAVPAPPPAPREPADSEAAEFAAAFRPEGVTPARTAAQDANGDGRREIVFASVVAGVARVDVAAWGGHAYTVVATGAGGPADEILDLQVRDATGEGAREIVVAYRGAPGTSASVWRWDGAAYVPLTARGGCMDGRPVFGVAGADVGAGRLTATCDAAQPPQTDAYRWDRRARVFTYEPGS